MPKKMRKLLSLCIALTLMLAACGGGASQAPGSNAPTSGSSASQGSQAAPSSYKDTLVVATNADARVIDPHGAGDGMSVNALLPVCETLLQYDPDGNLLPLLAESYEQLDDHSWKFKLKEGVKFHNGEEMKASDVVFSFKRACDPSIGAKVAYILNAVDPDGLEAVDDYTVILRTKKPFPPFVSYLPYVGCVVISEKAYQDPDAPNHPVGTGPFKFVSWAKGDRLTYDRFDDYWGEKPNYEHLIIKAIPENNSRLIELETGAADIAIQLSVNEMSKIQDNSKLRLETAQTTVFTSILMNTVKPPFDNQKFRQAIDYAIDEEAVVQAVHRGAAIYTPGPVVPHQKYFYDGETSCRYDPEKAKQLLAESGVDMTGRVLEIATNENQPRIDLSTIVQNQLKENLGIEVKITVMESASYMDYTESTEKDMFISGWGAVGFPDPDNNLYGPHHSSQIPQNNTTNINSPELDALLEQSRTMTDSPEREKIVKEAQMLLRDLTASIAFDNPTNLIGVQSYIEGFQAMPTTHQYYNTVRIAGQ